MTTNTSGPIWVNVNHPTPAGKPPATEVGVLGWLRANLFSGFWNSLFTILTLVATYFIISGALILTCVAPDFFSAQLFIPSHQSMPISGT